MSTNKRFNKLNDGFSLAEVIVGVAIVSVFFSAVLAGVSNLYKLSGHKKERVYEVIEEIDTISWENYFEKES